MFSSTPGVEAVQGCVRKHLGWHHLRTLEARKEAATPTLTLPTPRLCVVSSGRPASVLAAFRMRRARGWPTGVYTQCEAVGLWVVVLAELPRTRDTLALRLMGRGAVWKAAVEDLKRLPRDAWERERLLPVLVEWRLTVADDLAPRDPEAEMDMATGHELFEAFERQAIERGEAKGLREAIAVTCEARGLKLTAARRAQLEGEARAEVLRGWLTRALTAARTADVFAAR